MTNKISAAILVALITVFAWPPAPRSGIRSLDLGYPVTPRDSAGHLDLLVGQAETLSVTVHDTLGAIVAKPTVSWSSGNTSVASVSKGVVTAKAVGYATITATSGGVKSTVRACVSPGLADTLVWTTRNAASGVATMSFVLPKGSRHAFVTIYTLGVVGTQWGTCVHWAITSPHVPLTTVTHSGILLVADSTFPYLVAAVGPVVP